MIKLCNIKMPLEYTSDDLAAYISKKLKLPRLCDKDIILLKKSLDARHKDNIHFVLTVAFATSDDNAVMKKNRSLKNLSLYEHKEYTLPKKA